MIFFSRWGFLLLPIFAVIGLFVGAVSNRLVGSDHGDITIIVAGLVAAGLTWKVGSVLNDPAKDRAVIDAKTGAHVKLKRRHSLMFIPIQYYALLFLLIAGLGLVSLMPELKAAMDEEQRNADAYANSHRSTVSAQPTAHTNATTTSGQNTPSAGSPTTRPTQSDASQTFSWTIKAEKDQMSGEVEKKAVGEVDLPDGTIAQGEATCSLFTLVFTISTFHGKTAVDFPWHGDTTSVRTRVDEQNIKTLTVTQENFTNSINILVYDPAALDAYVRSVVGAQMPSLPQSTGSNGDSNTDGHGAGGIITIIRDGASNVAVSQATAKADAYAVGKLEDFSRMRSIHVELALADNSTNVIELNPGDANLQAFASACAGSFRRH